MNWVIVLLVSTLSLQVLAKQEGNTKGAVSRQNLPDRNVRLDPLLRRALLRALTELEKEAAEKVRSEESRNTRSEPNTASRNFLRNLNPNEVKDEIQNTADSIYPSPPPTLLRVPTEAEEEEISTNRYVENTDNTSPAPIPEDFLIRTASTVEEDLSTSAQEPKIPTPSVTQPDIASNLISEDVSEKEKGLTETTENLNQESTEKKEQSSGDKESKKSGGNDNEVDIFKAPLVAAFTLHQDSKGTPHSVIPLFRNNIPDNQRQQLQQQQQLQLQQQQQQLQLQQQQQLQIQQQQQQQQQLQLQQQQQQQQQQQLQLQQQQQQQQPQQQSFVQNQFIPSVTITPLSQPNQFNQPTRFFPTQNVAPSFASSTVFPPLVSNSILPQNFPSSVFPPQTFQASTTIAPFRSNQFISTIAPQRNISPQPFPSTLLPPQDFSVVPSHNFNFSPTPQPSFAAPATAAPAPGFQPISIPPVTLPLQNEARFQTPIIVPSLSVNSDQGFLQNQEQQRIRNQFLLEEQNRQRQLEEQNRQRQIEEQNRQRQIEEQNRQRQIEEQNRLNELARQRQLEEERQKQLLQQQSFQQQSLRHQRQEQGVDFQRSLGFSFNQNSQSITPTQSQNNGFSFHIQPSQSFVSPVNFQVETRNRVNRQEGFGSTGNLGINHQAQRNFGSVQTHFQSNQIFPPFQAPQQYRTIPEEHYRNLQINQQFQQVNRFPQFSQQQNFQQQNNPQDVNKQLQKLLFQSGVATSSGQEDLNIVSKVLALNHERSDTNVEDTIIANERRVSDPSEKSLAVGEIKDV